MSLENGYGDIYVINADGSGRRQVTKDLDTYPPIPSTDPPIFHDTQPAWSPDGSRIVYQCNPLNNPLDPLSGHHNDICVINADGTGWVNLTSDDASDADPEWSPDGLRIAFNSNRSGSSQVFTMNPDGTSLTEVAGASQGYAGPDWSPDGDQLAFSDWRDDGIYLANLAGGGATSVTNSSGRDWYPAFSPNGEKLVFVSDRDGNSELYVIDADGTPETRLTTRSGVDHHPDWGSNITVPDTTPPVVTVPADMVEEATGPSGVNASFTASAVDDVDGAVSVSCAPASGSMFPLGVTQVECSASDSLGNTGTGSFMITVQDTTAPTLLVPGPLTEEATAPAGAAVTFSVSASDLVDGPVAVVCAPVSGSTFVVGDTTVTCSATDAAWNSASDTFVVTVEDTTPPTLSMPAGVTEEATSAAGAAVTFSVSASDLVDGPVAVVCAPVSGSTFAVGDTTVTCSATDAAGNTGAGSFVV